MLATRALCKEVSELSRDALESCYLAQLGDFKDLISQFDNMRHLLSLLSRCEAFDELPASIQQRSQQQAQVLLDWFNSTVGIQRGIQNAQVEHDNARNRFQGLLEKFYTSILPAFSYAASIESMLARTTLFTEVDAKLRQLAETMAADADKAKAKLAEIEHSAVQAEKARERAAQEATSTAISAQKEKFSREAVGHRNQSRAWMIVGALLATIAGLFAYQVWIDAKDAVALAAFVSGSAAPQGLSTGLAIQLITSKIAVMALLVSFTFWAGRMYRASVHNEIVNQHRANALATFETFVDGASPEIKAAVLLQTTSCIFAAQPTGLISNEADPHPMAYVADFARAVGASGHSSTPKS